MKIRFTYKEMLPFLRLVKNVVPAGKYAEPVHRCVRIVTDGEYGVVLHASDGEHGIRINVRCDVVESGEVLVPLKELVSSIADAGQWTFELSTADEGLTELTWANHGAESFESVVVEDDDVLPEVAEWSAESWCAIPIESMHTIVDRVCFSIDKNGDRFALAGVCFDPGERGTIDAVATDGRRMAVQTIGTMSHNGYIHERALLPVKPLVLLSKCLKNNVVTDKYSPGGRDSLNMSVADGIATFHCGEVTIFTRLIEGRFPGWRTIVPKSEQMHKAVVHGWDFHEALKIFKTRCDSVKFTIANGTLTLESKTTKQTLSVDCDVDGAIGFNPKFWIDIAKVLGGSCRALSKDMRLFFPNELDPAMLTTDDGYCYVVMPLSDVGVGFPVIPAAVAERERKVAEIKAKYPTQADEAAMQAESDDDDDWDDDEESDDDVRTDCEFDDVVYHDVDDMPVVETPADVVKKWIDDKVTIAAIGFGSDDERRDVESGIKSAIVNTAADNMDWTTQYHEACADEECPQWKRDYYKANARAQAQASQNEFAMDDDEESSEMDTVTVWCDDVVEAEVESNAELDSDGYVTWECFDTMPKTVTLDGLKVCLMYRPYFCHDEGVFRAMGERVEDSFMVEWTGTADYCEWDNPSRIVTLDEYNAENVGNAHLHVPTEVLDGYEQESDVVPDEWVEDMFPGAECHVKAESVEKPTAYVPSIESALAEMIKHSGYPDILDGSTLATVQREDGRVKTGALLKNKGRGHVFMKWETGFVYRIPAKACKQSKSHGFTVLTLSDTTLRKERKLQNIFTARSLF